MAAPRDGLRSGVRDALPLLAAELPFGMLIGVAAADVGFSLDQAVAMSVAVFTGAAQLAVIQLLSEEAPVAVVVLAGLVVNVRYLVFAASVAPYFAPLRRRWRWSLAYLVTDPVYALAIARFRDGDVAIRWYFLGVAAPMWLAYQVGTVLGVVVGARLPAALGVDFVVPLMFLAILVPMVSDAASALAAVTGGVVAVLGAGVPLELGLVVGTVVGTLVGTRAGEVTDA